MVVYNPYYLFCPLFFFLMIRRPPRSTLSSSSAASDVYKRQVSTQSTGRTAHNTSAHGSMQDEGQWNYFCRGVEAAFKRWTVLRLAVEGGWGHGDPEENERGLYNQVLNLFTKGQRVYQDEIEHLLDEQVSERYNTDADDGSCAEVSLIITQLFDQCCARNYAGVEQLVALAATSGAASSQYAGGNSDNEDGEDMDEDEDDEMGMAAEPKPPPEVDDDGFTVVTKGSRRYA
eukprot:TRINITY_DN33369_c0_g1_i2.p1 TRINITY_DN33369_c0_g1~~TRINITY_DN33369_c0_g1_i2.p1  ORF type:complete len:231 (+),score=48.98 TRINITY_DN33369_c0_g1_i2:62-754(+)